jgi:hypothetical protein
MFPQPPPAGTPANPRNEPSRPATPPPRLTFRSEQACVTSEVLILDARTLDVLDTRPAGRCRCGCPACR